MNPVYSPVQPGTPYGNPKNMAFTGKTNMHMHIYHPVYHYNHESVKDRRTVLLMAPRGAIRVKTVQG